MNLGECKKKVIKIITEYSSNNVPITDEQNFDYLKRIPGFISDAQIEISKLRPVYKKNVLNTPSNTSTKYNRYTKPTDFRGIFSITKDDEPFFDFVEDVTEICIPLNYSGDFVLTYIAEPTVLTDETLDTVELQIDKDVQHITCYYAAAMVYIDDSQDISDLMLAEYKRMYGSIKSKNMKNSQVQNSVYDIWGDLYNG